MSPSTLRKAISTPDQARANSGILKTVASILRRTARRLLRVALLPMFALTMTVAMWVAVVIQTGTERQSSRADAVAQSQALARVLSEHVNYILRQSDHATQLFKLSYEAGGGALRMASFSRRGGLLDSVLPARLGLPMARIDAQGRPVDLANGFATDSLAGDPLFKALADGDSDQAHFSSAVQDARTSTWQIRVGRRLNDSSGQFAGAIVLMIDPYLFVDDYDRLDVDADGALVLMSVDGLSVGRAGDNLFSSATLAFTPQRATDASSEELVPTPPFDRVSRIYSHSDMPRYGLVAVVGVESGVAMARFERHRRLYLGIATLATLLILLVTGILMNQSRQLRTSMHAARSAQAILRAAADGSLDGFLILKAWPGDVGPVQDFVIVDLNEKAASMINRQRSALINTRVFATLPRFRQTGFFETYVKVYLSGQPLEEEVEVRIDGDAPRWIHHQIVPLHDGVAITSRDITARKHAEIEIRNNRGFLQSLIEHLPLLIYVKSLREKSFGAMMVWNHAAEEVTGYSADNVVGQIDQNAFPPGYALCNSAEDEAMLADPKVVDLPEKPLLHPDGSTRYLHSMAVPLFDEHGKPEFLLCIAEDVTRRREQEQSLRASEAHLTAVTNASPLGLVRTDARGNCTYVNKRFETITGLTREQSLGMGWLAAFEGDESQYMPSVFEHQRKHDEPFVRIARARHTNGRAIWASTKIAAIRINGRIEGFIGSIDDITTLRDAELALRESEARLRTIADTLPTMVAYIDASQTYRFQNRAYDNEFGRGVGAVLGKTVREAVGPTRYAELEPQILRALAGETLMFEEQDATERTLEVTYIPQMGEDGVSVIGFHVMRQDVTSQKHEKKRLLKLAQVDALTGLANRAGFMHKLASSMQQSLDEDHLMALMYMDIDHFKPVNDTYGHQVGDALLKAFSARLVQSLRASDTIARLGGDEFTIIMDKLVRQEDAVNLADKIVKAMQQPFVLDEATVSVSASIGLAFFRDGPVDPDALIRQADRLLYQAKQAGRNTYRVAA